MKAPSTPALLVLTTVLLARLSLEISEWASVNLAGLTQKFTDIMVLHGLDWMVLP